MYRIKTVLLLTISLFIVNSCSDDEGPTGNTTADPNGEEELLVQFGNDESADAVKVMTRNVYIGTDVGDLLTDATSIFEIPGLVTSAFNALQSTDFSKRAKVLADEIEKTKPHVIGLQEVAKVFYQSPGDFLAGNPVPANELLYDYLEILVAELSSRGLSYSAATILENADIELPMNTSAMSDPGSVFDDVRLVDRDVILVRSDVQTSNAFSVQYSAELVVDTTLNIAIPRGYNSVEAQIGTNTYRIVNTHLEAFDPVDILRSAQLTELLAALEDETLPLIMLGDFNAAAPANPVYQAILSAGFTDSWTENTLTYNAGGFTFGHDGDLKNKSANFFTRIDFIFVRSQMAFKIGEAFVTGDELRDRTSSGLWPSDHGGVIVKIDFNP